MTDIAVKTVRPPTTPDLESSQKSGLRRMNGAAGRAALAPLSVLLVKHDGPGRDAEWEDMVNVVPFALTTVESMEDAEAALMNVELDSVWLDLDLKDACSIEVIRYLRSCADDAAVIVWSSTVDGRLRNEAMRAGADDVVPKENTSVRTFVEGAVDAVERRRARQERVTELETQLALSDCMVSLGALAAGVAHELNNPLALVVLNLELAMRALEEHGWSGLPEHLQEELEDATEGAERLRKIVRDLRTISRPDDRGMQSIDVHQVIESTLRMTANEVRHRARLVRDFDEVPFVRADEGKLGQVLLNVLMNAAQAIPTGNQQSNEIRITTRAQADETVIVTISDTGGGIPVAVQPKLFTPFFTTKSSGAGTGLGLAISKRIMKSFGGDISFETEVGAGTSFHLRLPRALSSPPERAPEPPAPTTHRGRILTIDDEESVVSAIQHSLAAEHDVIACSNAADGLALLEEGQRFDLVLCDLMMPQMSGMDFHERVRALDESLAERIIFMTGGAFTPCAREFLDTSCNPAIEKPFRLRSLRVLVNKALNSWHLQSA